MSDAPNAYRIEQAMAAWHAARARLLADDADLAGDEAALIALLGPETGEIEDILHRVLRAALHAKDMAEAAEQRIADIQSRRDRYRRRAEQARGTAFAIMDALGIRKAELPDVTATIAAPKAAVVVTDETALPEQFIRTRREPDKAALMVALKGGAEVPGAVLNNGLPSLQLRTK